MKSFNKKADISGRKVVFYIIFGFMAAMAFLIIVFLIPSKASEISTIPRGLEDYILINRLLNSKDCFAFQDQAAKRTYEGIIDISKFNQQNLDKCYSEKDTSLKAYRIELQYENEKKSIATANWEGFLSESQKFGVNTIINGKIKRGIIQVDIQNAK